MYPPVPHLACEASGPTLQQIR